MAITIVQQPEQLNAAYTELLYVISGSTNTSQPQFEYVLDVYESGSNTILSRLTQPVNPAGVAVFNPKKIFQGNFEYSNEWKDVFNSGSLSSSKDYVIQVGEKYAASISSSITLYPNQISSSIGIVPTYVDPNLGSYNLYDVYPYLNFDFDLTLGDWQTSDNPYLFHVNSGRNPYKIESIPDTVLQSYQPLGDNDYFTLSYFLSGSFNPFFSLINLYDDNDSIIFAGYGYIRTGFLPASQAYFIGALTGSGNIFSLSAGPQTLSNVPMRTQLTGSLGNQTFGQVFSSGSWSLLQVSPIFRKDNFVSSNYADFTFFVNEKKLDLLPNTFIVGEQNPNIPYFVNCNEKLRFAFINKYGTWDYWNNYNPVRRSTEITRDNVKLPKANYSNATSAYSYTTRGEDTYNVEKRDRFVVDTPLLDQPFANWLEQLLESPSVFIQRGDDLIPIIITNSSYTANKDENRQKVFTYTIEFEPARQPYGEWVPEYVNS